MEEADVSRRTYKFTNKKHTRRGMISSGMGFLALLLLGGLFYLSYRQSGNAGAYTGFLGFLAMLATMEGLILGLQGLREEDRFYFFSYFGCMLNGLLLVAWMLLYVLGM